MKIQLPRSGKAGFDVLLADEAQVGDASGSLALKLGSFGYYVAKFRSN